MDAMTILERCRRAEDDKRQMEQRIQRYRDSAQSVTQFFGGVGGGGTPTDKMSTFAGEIDDLERQKEQREREYHEEIAVACKLLDMIPETESKVLHMFYIKGMTLGKVAKELHYSSGYARNVKAEGVKQTSMIDAAIVLSLLPVWYRDLYQDE